MSQLFQTGVVVSGGNSTNIALPAGASFVGEIDDVTSYEEIDINIAANPGTVGDLYFEFSPDGYNWDVSVWVGGATFNPNVMPPQALRVVLPYFRVIYTNGNVNQTSFRLTVVYHRSSGTRLTRYLNQAINNTEPVENVRAFIGGKTPSGEYDHVDVTTSNALVVDGSNVIQPVSGTVTTDQGLPTTLSGAWPIEITDGYNGPVSITPPSTAAMSTDSALVVAISPNSPITTVVARPSTNNTSTVEASATNITLLSPNSIRLGATVYNDSSSLLYLKLGINATATDFTIKLFPQSYYEVPFGFIGEVDGFWVSAIGFARIGELTQ